MIFVPQITQLLLGDAIISSKTDLRSGSKKEKRSYSKFRNNRAMSTTLSFFRILCLKQQSILRCFCSLKSEKGLFSIKFFSLIFRSKIIAHTAEMDQIKCFDQK